MSDWAFLNLHRCKTTSRYVPPQYCTDDSFGFCGMFRFTVDGKLTRCVVSDGENWQHVSVSIEGESKPPTWKMMCDVKELFFEDTDWVVQFHPPHSEYVNHHPGCLHLWRYTGTDKEMPTPPSIFVGLKKKYA